MKDLRNHLAEEGKVDAQNQFELGLAQLRRQMERQIQNLSSKFELKYDFIAKGLVRQGLSILAR